MIGYTTVGANDFEKSKAFFDAVLAPLGVARSFGMDRIQFYGAPGAGALAVCKPYDGEKATIGNGMMVALACPSVPGIGAPSPSRSGAETLEATASTTRPNRSPSCEP